MGFYDSMMISQIVGPINEFLHLVNWFSRRLQVFEDREDDEQVLPYELRTPRTFMDYDSINDTVKHNILLRHVLKIKFTKTVSYFPLIGTVQKQSNNFYRINVGSMNMHVARINNYVSQHQRNLTVTVVVRRKGSKWNT
jgi:hypothetical protein